MLDVIVFTQAPADLQLLPGANGVLLCDIFTPPGIVATVTNPPTGIGSGGPFLIPVPANCALVGVQLCAQGGYAAFKPAGQIGLTNALDLTIGSY